MEIKHTNQNGIDFLQPKGRIDTITSSDLDQSLQTIIQKSPFHVVINFADVPYISSAGLRVLVKTSQIAQSNNSKLVLTHLNESVKEVLDITGFTELFTIE